MLEIIAGIIIGLIIGMFIGIIMVVEFMKWKFNIYLFNIKDKKVDMWQRKR